MNCTRGGLIYVISPVSALHSPRRINQHDQRAHFGISLQRHKRHNTNDLMLYKSFIYTVNLFVLMQECLHG